MLSAFPRVIPPPPSPMPFMCAVLKGGLSLWSPTVLEKARQMSVGRTRVSICRRLDPLRRKEKKMLSILVAPQGPTITLGASIYDVHIIWGKFDPRLCLQNIYSLSANLLHFLTPSSLLCGRHIWKPPNGTGRRRRRRRKPRKTRQAAARNNTTCKNSWQRYFEFDHSP